MFAALRHDPKLQALLPFVRQFYGRQSEYYWYDDEGDLHIVLQGEGGEQGDPLMPALFSIGQHPALVAVQALLKEGEFIFAYLDDIYVLCDPGRVTEIFMLVVAELKRHAGIDVNLGKTKVWNRANEKPLNVDSISGAAWMGD